MYVEDNSLIRIIRLLESVKVWPKVILLSGVYCTNTKLI
jgi:hypothetical protein